ncbi:MAG: hypothetical protein MJ214_00800 [Bacilli bacterium]|nr:hypothetical protein [Bacilli bacterium]
MKKALLLFSGLAIFSMAACSKTTINPNEVDPSDLYKMKYTENYAMGGVWEYYDITNELKPSVVVTRRATLREYDSHNRVTAESTYIPNVEMRKGIVENGLTSNGNVSSFIINYGTREEDTSYTNRYDKNGRLAHRIVLHKNNLLTMGSADVRVNNYSVENYSYDNLNRLVFKETNVFGRNYEPAYPDYPIYSSGVFSNGYNPTPYPYVQDSSYYMTEQYIYSGDSKEFKTYIRSKVMRAIATSVQNITINREFDENNNIVSETCVIDSTYRSVPYEPQPYLIWGENSNTSSYSYYSSITYVTNNTYDKYNCLINSKTYAYSADIYGSSISDKIYESETISSYYKNDPKKLLNSVTTEYRYNEEELEPYYPGNVSNYGFISSIHNNYSYLTWTKTLINKSCSYDSQGRLKNDSQIKYSRTYSSPYDMHAGNSSYGTTSKTQTYNIYTY